MSRTLAQELRATYLRVDVIEQAMRIAGVWADGPAGYVVCYEMASLNLRLGLDVIADTVNPVQATRTAWRNVAMSLGVPFVEVEVICSDKDEHRMRITSRRSDIAGLMLPTWDDVEDRLYEAWDRDHIVVDTAHRTVEESLKALRGALSVR